MSSAAVAESLFFAALEKPTETERAAYLDLACGGDAELRRQVENLLHAYPKAVDFLQKPAVEQWELFEAMQALNASADDMEPNMKRTEAEGSAEEGTALNFLEPATRPDSLGRIGHYEVLQVIGKGGFGIVFRAFDDVLRRVVAVKVLSPLLAATSPARKRFLREARSSAQVRHENVVQVYEVGEQPLPYIAMEFIPGETLQQRLDRIGPIDVPDVLRIGRQIAEGLAAAHATDLIHRDIKLGNVLLEGGTQRVKITDFGLARAADDASISHSGIIAGTPMFMAPEQAKGEMLDQRADLFSLGSVLYQMVSGRPPFRANGTLAVLKRVVEDTPRPIREIIPETPQWLCDIISKLHAKSPEDRYQSAREVADVLAGFERQFAAHKEHEDFIRIPDRKPVRARRSHRLEWMAAAVVAIAGLGVWLVSAGMPSRSNTGAIYDLGNDGEMVILPAQGLQSVIVLCNDEGVIDEMKLHTRATDWLSMEKTQTLNLLPGKYQLNVAVWPQGTEVTEWEVTTSGPFGRRVWIPVVDTHAIISVERGQRVTLQARMRSVPPRVQ